MTTFESFRLARPLPDRKVKRETANKEAIRQLNGALKARNWYEVARMLGEN